VPLAQHVDDPLAQAQFRPARVGLRRPAEPLERFSQRHDRGVFLAAKLISIRPRQPADHVRDHGAGFVEIVERGDVGLR